MGIVEVALAATTDAGALAAAITLTRRRMRSAASLARPGGNATGVNFLAAELAAKRLELLRTLVPAATRVAALLNPAEPTIYTANRRDLEAAASAMGLQLRFPHTRKSRPRYRTAWLG
jgi:ABC-type uncharacterized transport system substrate-binding protein